MNIISFDVEINESELLVNKSNELLAALKRLTLAYIGGFFIQLIEKSENLLEYVKICGST